MISASDEQLCYEQTVIDKVMTEIKANDGGSFERILMESKHLLLSDLVRAAAKENQTPEQHRDELRKAISAGNEQSIKSLLGLSSEIVESIKHAGLDMVTYVVEIDEEQNLVTFTFPNEDTPFEVVKLDSKANIDWAYFMQLASIVIEGVLLFLAVIGLKVPINKQIIKKTAVEKLAEELASSSGSFLCSGQKFIEPWNASGASALFDKAKALFDLLKDVYSLGILWNVIKQLCAEMSWWEWTKAAALITAPLIAAFATGGLALIAKIALALKDAYDFYQKIQNLSKLHAIKQRWS